MHVAKDISVALLEAASTTIVGGGSTYRQRGSTMKTLQARSTCGLHTLPTGVLLDAVKTTSPLYAPKGTVQTTPSLCVPGEDGCGYLKRLQTGSNGLQLMCPAVVSLGTESQQGSHNSNTASDEPALYTTDLNMVRCRTTGSAEHSLPHGHHRTMPWTAPSVRLGSATKRSEFNPNIFLQHL